MLGALRAALLLLVHHGVGQSSQRLFYIYELPSHMIDMWPSHNVTLFYRTTVWKHDFNENEGFGKHMESAGFFETWQYASFRIILSRLRRSPLRTFNISEANLFFVPYDSGAECYVDENGNYREKGNPVGLEVLNFLKAKPTFTRNFGYDHFFVHSSTLVAHVVSQKLKTLYEYAANATVLTVENLPRVHHFIKNLHFVQPIPMASVYHWTQTAARNSFPALRTFRQKRDIYISFFGSANTGVPINNKLRIRLFEQCQHATQRFNAADPMYNVVRQSYQHVCVSGRFKKSVNRDAATINEVMKTYERSVFCLCPIGDTPIRRALFDSLLAGCIPVIFSTYETPSPIDQYNWHFSPYQIRNAFVFLNATKHHLNPPPTTNYIDILVSSYSPNQIGDYQREIASIARRIQYSMPPDVQRFGLPNITARLPTWTPPFPDAVDIILEKLFQKQDVHRRMSS